MGWHPGISSTCVHTVRFRVMQRGTSQPVPLTVSIPCVPGCEQCSCNRPTIISGSEDWAMPKGHPCHMDLLVPPGLPASLQCSSSPAIPSPPTIPISSVSTLLHPTKPEALCLSCFIHSQHSTPDAMLHATLSYPHIQLPSPAVVVARDFPG